MCAIPKSVVIQRRGGVLLSLHQTDDDVKFCDSRYAEALWPLQLSPQETLQVPGYLLSFIVGGRERI